jgi:hypothetical protein
VIVQAHSVVVPNQIGLDHGEGWLSFQWVDPLCGTEGITIHLDGWCSRNMPIRSAQGPPEFVDLQRNRLKLRFTPAMAQRLEIDEEVEIQFVIPESEFSLLKQTIDCFKEFN